MGKLTVDGREFDMETLSVEARKHLSAIKACDQRLDHLNAQLLITQEARESFYAKLSQSLPADPEDKSH